MRANRQEEMTALQEQLKDVRLKADSEVADLQERQRNSKMDPWTTLVPET